MLRVSFECHQRINLPFFSSKKEKSNVMICGIVLTIVCLDYFPFNGTDNAFANLQLDFLDLRLVFFFLLGSLSLLGLWILNFRMLICLLVFVLEQIICLG